MYVCETAAEIDRDEGRDIGDSKAVATRIVIPSARCRPNADHYPSDVGDALDEQL